MMNHRNPEYFLTIVREHGISRAAEKLYITQSSLSQYVAKLEKELGVRLFDRTQSPIALTPAGELYRNYLESSTFLYRRFLSDLSDLDQNREQSIQLGSGNWRGTVLVPEVLPQFLQQHPQTRVTLHEFPVSELYIQMEDGKVDFSVMNTTPDSLPENFIHETIAYERILLVLNRNHSLVPTLNACFRQGSIPDLHLLEQVRLITLSSTLTVGRQVNNFLRKNLLNFSNCLTSTNTSTVLRLVAKNMGFCFLVETGLQDAARYPELVWYDLRSSDLSIPLSLVYKNSAYLSPLTREFMNTIREYYRGFIQDNNHRLSNGAAL